MLNLALTHPKTCADHHHVKTPNLSLQCWSHLEKKSRIIENFENRGIPKKMSMGVFPFATCGFTDTQITEDMKRQGGFIHLTGLSINENQNT